MLFTATAFSAIAMGPSLGFILASPLVVLAFFGYLALRLVYKRGGADDTVRILEALARLIRRWPTR